MRQHKLEEKLPPAQPRSGTRSAMGDDRSIIKMRLAIVNIWGWADWGQQGGKTFSDEKWGMTRCSYHGEDAGPQHPILTRASPVVRDVRLDH